MRINLGLIFCYFIINKSAVSLQILYVACFPSPSHGIWHGVLAEGLALKGHNITYFGCQKDHIPKLNENFTLIYLDGLFEKLAKVYSNVSTLSEIGPLEMVFEMKDWEDLNCKSMLESNGLQQLLKYPTNFFDAIVIDVTLSCLLPVIEKFNYPPTIGTTPFQLSTFVSYFYGNSIQHTSYVPDLGLEYTDKMNFWQRVYNAMLVYLELFIKSTNINYQMVETANKMFGTKSSFDHLADHVSIILTNTDPILNYPQPLAPNYIPVGGLHVRPPKKLPQDIQQILDKAKNGVIVMSLGTNIRSDHLSDKKIRAFLSAFAKLNQTILWKFESEIKNIPKNVIVKRWLPQSDILAHPNVKLLIGHGGALSTYEAEIRGVPIVVVPFFLDQLNSMALIVERELGVFMDVNQADSADYIYITITKLLDNDKYSENMKKTSSRYASQPLPALEKAILYIEYTIKHNGTKFLSTSARTLPFFVIEKLDVFLFFLILLLLTVCVCKRVIRLLLNLCKTKRKKFKIN